MPCIDKKFIEELLNIWKTELHLFCLLTLFFLQTLFKKAFNFWNVLDYTPVELCIIYLLIFKKLLMILLTSEIYLAQN